MQFFSKPRPGLRALALPLLVSAALSSATGMVAPAFADDLTHLTITHATAGSSQQVSLGLNKSLIVDLPEDASEVIVSQPSIAAANMRSKRRAVLEGMGIGDTNLFFLDAKGAQIATLEVSVVRDASTLSTALARLLPGSHIDVQGFGDHIILAGTAVSQDDVAKATTIAGQFAGGDANVASLVTVSGAQQVSLKVTIAEVSRSAVKQLGIQLTGSLAVGALSGSLLNQSALGGASSVVTGNSIAAGFSVPGASMQATLHALEQRGLLRKLDEPTLTAISGQPAELNAGGQIPVLNPPDQNGTVSYTYKQIGVKLDFTPTVKSNGNLGLVVDSSVTDVDNTYSVSVGGVSIPGTEQPRSQDLGGAAGRRDAVDRRPVRGQDAPGDQLAARSRQYPDPGRTVPLARFHPRPDRTGDPGDALPHQPRRHAGAAHRRRGGGWRCRGQFPRPHAEALRRWQRPRRNRRRSITGSVGVRPRVEQQRQELGPTDRRASFQSQGRRLRPNLP